MKMILLKDLSSLKRNSLLKRPAIQIDKTYAIVKPILDEIKKAGMSAVKKYAAKYDGFESDTLLVSKNEFDTAEKSLNKNVKLALQSAAKNIEKFHSLQIPFRSAIETIPGVECLREFRPIDNAGLYIPGGSAVLPSTMLMLGIPAKLAGCGRVTACSPAKDNKLSDALLFAAKIAEVSEIYKVGGAQAVGLMAYGAGTIEKVNKIFGPGNQYVTAAKSLVSIDNEGCAIDMPAGPSEVLIIADSSADPSYIAADLLSQAEHGSDSQVILITDSIELADKAAEEIKIQIELLPRKETANDALVNSFILIVDSLSEAIKFSNEYAPEHLILNINEADKYVSQIINAGSVFLGPYSPESAGDYASGTNHSLPTYGYAKSFSGVSVEAFMKSITFQKLSKDGLNNIAPTVITLAETEGLQAHANAVKVRMK